VRSIVVLLLVALAGSASGIDQPIAGKRLVLRQSPKGASFVLVARDVRVNTPARGQLDDPRRAGAVLHIGNPDSGEWARFDLAAGGWTERQQGRLFRFRNLLTRGLGSEVRTLTIRDRKQLKIRAQRIGITLDELVQRSMAVVLVSGTHRYCALFGGTVKKDGPGRFAAKAAPPPAACPEPL
jgi:hypothetical protein